MAVIDNLVINIDANTQGATSGINRLTNVMVQVNSVTNKYTNSVRSNTSAQKQNTSETNKNAQAHKKAGDSAKHHSQGIGKLAAALKRILIYRAIRALIKSVTTTITEGVKRMYEWSEAHDQVFMKVMDMYATEKQYIRDATGAAVSALLQSLLPVIVQIADAFVELINKVQQFFRALAGENTWFKVDKVAAKFSTDTNNAAKAQKALNEQLMDFDKLNVIKTPKSSGKDDDEIAPLDGHWEQIDPKIKKLADEIKKLFEDLKTLWGKFEESGVWAAIDNLFSESNKATWDLIKTVFDKISNAKVGSGLATLIDGITQFSTSGIKNVTKIIDKWIDNGSIDDLFGDVGDILVDVANIADNLFDIIGYITDIVGSNSGESGSGLWLIHYVLGLINGILVGIKEMLEGDIGGGIERIFKSAFITPLLTIIRLGAQVIETFDMAIHPNDQARKEKWKAWYDQLDAIEEKLNGIKRTTSSGMTDDDPEAFSRAYDMSPTTSTDYWQEEAQKAGMSLTELQNYAMEAYGNTREYAMNASLERIKAAEKARKEEEAKITKIVNKSKWGNDKLMSETIKTYGKVTAKYVKLTDDHLNQDDRYQKQRKKNGSAWVDMLNKMYKDGKVDTKNYYKLLNGLSDNAKANLKQQLKDGKISQEEYNKKMKNLAAENKKAWFNSINEISKKWKLFAKNGAEYGKMFKTGLLDELKKIAKTELSVSVSTAAGKNQQLLNGKVRVETKAHGGFPDMGTMFIAGEVPGQAEMVGNINGRTGVASGAEITGIADAVYNTGSQEAALLRQLIAAVRSQNLVISPSASLGRVVNQSQRLYAGVTG